MAASQKNKSVQKTSADVKAKKKTEAKTKASAKSKSSSKTGRKGSGSLGYLTKEGVRNVWSNRLMSLASIAVLTSCLLLIGSAIMIFANINVLLENVQAQNVIMVYLNDDISTDDIDLAGQDIRLIADVDTAEFVSKEEAYQEQLESLGDDASLMDGLDENPLPDAYKIELKTLDNYDSVVESLKSIANVSSVRGNSDLASQVKQIKNAVSVVSIGMIVMLLAVSLFIIANTVRVTMYNRRLEISIMKAVGATNWFIRWPFIIEGIVIGIISGCLSELFVYALYQLTISQVGEIFSVLGGSVVSFSQYAGPMLGAFILVGILSGTVGSIVSMARYLKEQEGSVVSDDN